MQSITQVFIFLIRLSLIFLSKFASLYKETCIVTFCLFVFFLPGSSCDSVVLFVCCTFLLKHFHQNTWFWGWIGRKKWRELGLVPMKRQSNGSTCSDMTDWSERDHISKLKQEQNMTCTKIFVQVIFFYRSPHMSLPKRVLVKIIQVRKVERGDGGLRL